MLSKFFKPKWQHTNPVTRASAVRKLSDQSPEQFRILSKMATQDPDAHVRQTAVEQISEISQLIHLLEQEMETDTTAIEQGLAKRLQHESLSDNLITQLSQCKNPIAVFNSVSLTGHNDLLRKLLDTIDDEALLFNVVLSNAPIQVRKQAAEQINSLENIEKLAKETRQKDKTIQRIMREKLKSIKESEKQRALEIERATQLSEQIATLSNGEWFPLYPAKLTSLVQEWQAFSNTLDVTHREQVQIALERCQHRVDEQQSIEAAKQAAQQKRGEAERQAQQILAALQEATAQCQQQILSTDPANNDLIQDLIASSTQQWESLSDHLSHLEATFKQHIGTLQSAQTKAAATRDTLQKIDQFLEKHSIDSIPKSSTASIKKQAQKLLSQLDWPDTLEPPASLLALQALLGELAAFDKTTREKNAKAEAHFSEQLTQLETAINQGEIKLADRTAKKTADLFGRLNGATPDKLEQRYKLLTNRLQELKDWQGYAVAPKKEQLCEEMEALISKEMPAPEKARTIKQLQQQWKVLDSTDPFHSQAIWKRFKSASEQAYAPCEQHFAQQNEIRRYNLEQRQLICHEVSTYLNTIDWETDDWKAVEKVIQTAKEEWRRFVPVDRGPGQALQKQFNTLIVETENHFKVFKSQSMEIKQGLIDEVAQLTQSEDIQSAAEATKVLQKRWKEAGPTFHSQERVLWKNFRAHCDQVFARLQAATPSRDERQAIKEKLAEISQELTSFLEKPIYAQRNLTLMTEGQQLIQTYSDNLSPRDEERFNKASNAFEAQIEAFNNFIETPAIKQLIQQGSICDKFEEAILENADTGSLLDDWQLDINLPEHADLLLRKKTAEEVLNGSTSLEAILPASAQRLREICIRLEIALGEPSPEADQARRMEYQMQRLQLALEQQQQTFTLLDIKKLELEWSSTPFSQLHPELTSRFYNLLDKVFS